ncbi:hypothetical protein D9M71_769840 [compost metagenome]
MVPIATRVFAPTSVIVTFAAKVAAVMPSAATLIRSWPPAGLASKSRMPSWPKPAPKTKASLPAPPMRVSLPPAPVRVSLPAPPIKVLARPLPVPTKLPDPPKTRFSIVAPRV